MKNRKVNKSTRIKFGTFRTELLAWEEVERRKPSLANHPYGVSYYVVKMNKTKEGKRLWLAYCLKRKKNFK
jgi:hypothetical protein